MTERGEELCKIDQYPIWYGAFKFGFGTFSGTHAGFRFEALGADFAASCIRDT